MERKQPFRILSLDGGGLRGAYQASVLARWEHQWQTPIADQVDLIAGTSTGGLVGLAAAAEIPMDQVVRLYEQEASAIFPRRPGSKNVVRRLRAHANKGLHRIVEEIFKDRRMRDLKTKACMTSVDGGTWAPRVFKTPHSDDVVQDGDLRVADVAMATTAAPLYLPAHRIQQVGTYVDGGLWANNPAMVGVLEATTRLRVDQADVNLVSLGTGRGPTGSDPRKATRRSSWHWLAKGRLAQALMDAQSQAVHYSVRIMADFAQIAGYLRVNSPLRRPFAMDRPKHVPEMVERGTQSAMEHSVAARKLLEGGQ